MDLRKIKKLIDLLEESNLAEIEIKEGEETVRISRMPKGSGHCDAAAPQPASGARRAAAPAAAGTRPAAQRAGRQRIDARRPRRRGADGRHVLRPQSGRAAVRGDRPEVKAATRSASSRR